jgi:hypothetical protein
MEKFRADLIDFNSGLVLPVNPLWTKHPDVIMDRALERGSSMGSIILNSQGPKLSRQALWQGVCFDGKPLRIAHFVETRIDSLCRNCAG